MFNYLLQISRQKFLSECKKDSSRQEDKRIQEGKCQLLSSSSSKSLAMQGKRLEAEEKRVLYSHLLYRSVYQSFGVQNIPSGEV